MDNQLIRRNDDFQISELLFKYLRHWKWFMLSGFICCSLAVLYIKSSPNIYKRSAAVLIKDEGNITDISAAFSDMNPFKANTNVNNEIEAFKSPSIMQGVVKRLKLDISYTAKQGLKTLELYTQSPVTVSLTDAQDDDAFSFQVKLLPDSMVVLSEFELGKIRFEHEVTTRLNEAVPTPVGGLIISPTLFYSTDPDHDLIRVTKSSIKSATDQLGGKLNASLSSKENTIVVLEFTDISIQRADDCLADIIAVYNENWMMERNKVAINTSKFINERLPLIEEQLGGIDDDLEQFKSQNLLTDVHSAASLYMKESSEYSGKILEVRNQLSVARYLKRYLNNKSKISELLPTNTGINNLNLESAISQYNTLLLKRNGLIANSSDKNPVIVDMNNSLNSMRQSIIHTIDNLIIALNYQLSSLQAREARMTENIASNPGQEKHLISIEREQKIKESLYIYLLQKREENALSLAMVTTNTRVISPPSGSDAPIEPKKYMIMLFSLMMGMGIPFSIIWGRDILFPTVGGERDLEKLSIPLTGTIPQAHVPKGEKRMLFVREKDMDEINEAFRIVRTDLGSMCADKMKVIMFTSVDHGSGKSFMTINMAMCFALTGKKVVVLDLDLRKATLSKIISSPRVGMTGHLYGVIPEERIIIKNRFCQGFDIIPVGDIPPNPVELLLNGRLNLLINKLKLEYDYIFIDITPVGMIADATIVGKLSDLIVFVVRENSTERGKLAELKNLFTAQKFNCMTTILNGTETATLDIKNTLFYKMWLSRFFS